MKDIRNYKIKDFVKKDVEVIDSYMTVLSLVKPTPSFRKRLKKYGVNESLTELTWGQVNKLKDLMSSADLDSVFKAISEAYSFPLKKVKNMRIVQFYGCFNFLVQEINQIHKVENFRYQIIPDKYDHVKEAAGASEFDKFAEFPIVDMISKELPWDYEKVEKIPYMTMHVKLWYDAVKANYQIRYSQLLEASEK